MQKAGAALLDKIGPAILLGHSQGGAHLWAVADIRPHLVKIILGIEPMGPPFSDRTPIKLNPSRAWGLTDIPIHFSNPEGDPLAPLNYEIVPHNWDKGEVKTSAQQVQPARQLLNITHIPVLIVTAEASYHAEYERATVEFLTQAGMTVDWLRLWDVGIRGNGHMCFMEMNSDDIAKAIDEWTRKAVAKLKPPKQSL